VFGDPNRAANVFVFESPWDAFAVMDLLGWHKPKSVPDTAIVITRGAGNGKRVVGLFRPETTAYAFKQNDETKDGKNAADEWLADVCAYAGCKVLNVATPAQFKDVNDWTRAGATAADIMTGIEDAKPVESLSARAHLNEALSAETKSVQVEAQFLPGPFPIDALNDTQRRIAEAVASVHQLPIELAAIPALATTAAALGKGWKLTGAVNGRENFGNLYFIPGAPKSTGKGAAAQLAEPIIQASARLIDDWKGSEKPILETKRQVLEARAKHLTACLAHRKDRNRSLTDSELATFEAELRDANAELEHIKPMLAAAPSYHVGNATSEALAMKFARNDDTLFALAYEGGDTLRVMLGKYGKGESADFDLWLSGYSVEPYQSDRVLRGNVNITPCLTALIFCQPSLLRELYGNEEAFERGLTARVLPFICESSLQEDDGIERIVSTYHRDAWDDLITGLLDRRVTQLASDAPALVQCGADAREVFRAFHNESIRLRNGQFRDIEGELGRWRENACRIALGLCVADDLAARSLTAAQAERAVKLARWAHYSALQVMNSGRMERRLARVNKLRDLVAEYDSQVTLRILEKSHGFKPDEVERLAADFPSHFCLETKQNPKGGPLSRILTCSRRFA
ncbi:MAG TPA: DUF3987 domain-containing protein, partial [Candidatus Eisenbacteria bacterium]|nr:DUF3987 domain-containing protein [Candidatus Eisenbacteria bacterium]